MSRYRKKQTESYASLWDIVECKGRVGRYGSLRARLATWLAEQVASAVMRSPKLRKEFALSIGLEIIRNMRELERQFLEKRR